MATKPKHTNRLFGRSLSDFPNLTPVEKKLIECCRTGEWLKIGDGTRPEKKTKANSLRPNLIRFLLLDGDDQNSVHELGVQIEGAWIEGDWDLSFCDCRRPLQIVDSIINGELHMQNCIMPFLELYGSNIKGINADRATFESDVSLRGGFKSTGNVGLRGAQIGGNLNCQDANFEPQIGQALSADGAAIKGNLFLDENFKATAEIVLSSAQLGSLIDDPTINTTLILDGLTYTRITGGAPTDAVTRIAWLKKQPPDHLYENFKPQPWEQLIEVLRTMGHTDDADAVAIAKQDQLYRAGKITGINKIWHTLYGSLAGYGYRPSYTVFAMLVVWFISAMNFQMAGNVGLIGPTSAVIQSNPEMDKLCNVADNTHETRWTTCSALPQTYTTYSPFAYSLDLILPLVDLQQDKDWSPIVMKPDATTIIWLGVWYRFLMWFEILFGWMASLLLVAVLGNLVKKD